MNDALSGTLLTDVRRLIETGRRQAAAAVDAAVVELYWNIGRRIRRDVLEGERAAYGRDIIGRLAGPLRAEYGPSFSKRNLHHMVRAAEIFDAAEIVYAVRTRSSWSRNYTEPSNSHAMAVGHDRGPGRVRSRGRVRAADQSSRWACRA